MVEKAKHGVVSEWHISKYREAELVVRVEKE